ncbi:hypothetical protein KC332_g13893 [Hortaea werneckii]|uniref:Uncharacterized protein n=1 Tax=Hortaea werneckii EXF-2000 TaxID=1157616 RepID=A0A1Z5SM63_HORWE|nr:hypothetical protein KC358_g13162 [Hortaea werneckii]OTA20142.1 hypothetical protein BTJ68_15605 [Hortaea werneckii EXF-2000]KAI6809573.1 hypothetical protein KC350_g12882 [Hortaea werneckii]KAI6910323.1 hypothetical protein KC348_g13250 [Hortaea werneckii]KAI6925225.1 hypothetical protein KC341_g13561 [Hortaea werneckii]
MLHSNRAQYRAVVAASIETNPQVVLTQAGISSMTLKRHCAETTDATSAYTETTITCADALKPAGSPRRKHSESNA